MTFEEWKSLKDYKQYDAYKTLSCYDKMAVNVELASKVESFAMVLMEGIELNENTIIKAKKDEQYWLAKIAENDSIIDEDLRDAQWRIKYFNKVNKFFNDFVEYCFKIQKELNNNSIELEEELYDIINSNYYSEAKYINDLPMSMNSSLMRKISKVF